MQREVFLVFLNCFLYGFLNGFLFFFVFGFLKKVFSGSFDFFFLV